MALYVRHGAAFCGRAACCQLAQRYLHETSSQRYKNAACKLSCWACLFALAAHISPNRPKASTPLIPKPHTRTLNRSSCGYCHGLLPTTSPDGRARCSPRQPTQARMDPQAERFWGLGFRVHGFRVHGFGSVAHRVAVRQCHGKHVYSKLYVRLPGRILRRRDHYGPLRSAPRVKGRGTSTLSPKPLHQSKHLKHLALNPKHPKP